MILEGLYKRIELLLQKSAGGEFTTAIGYAQYHQKRIETIDIPMDITAKKVAAIPSWRAAKIALSTFWSGLLCPPSKEASRVIEAFLKADQIYDKLTEEERDGLTSILDKLAVEDSFGDSLLRKIFVEDRDAFMASKLRELSRDYDNVVVVIGEGHVSGVIKALPTRVQISEAAHRVQYLLTDPPNPYIGQVMIGSVIVSVITALFATVNLHKIAKKRLPLGRFYVPASLLAWGVYRVQSGREAKEWVESKIKKEILGESTKNMKQRVAAIE